MVQVDVFWAYGWGASLAVAGGQPLARSRRPLESMYFTSTLLFLSLCWAPTGMLLLLRHPSWETMQVAPHLRAMSEWLVLAFGLTNITQGILGFWVGQRLLARGREDLARLNWIAAYFGMFFILLYGWDGLGYDRFLYDRDMLPGSPAWTAGAATGAGVWAGFRAFLRSSVACTLYLDGAYLLPPFFWLAVRWRREAAAASGAPSPGAALMVLRYLGAVFGVGLGAAAFSAFAVHSVITVLGGGGASRAAWVGSYLLGLPAGLGLLWLMVRRRGPAVHRASVRRNRKTET